MDQHTIGDDSLASNGTGAGLISFLTWAIDKNELVSSTASALRTGCQKVLAVDQSWQSIELRSADVDSMLVRFQNKHRGDMKDRTREQYAQRFRQAVEMYIRWLDGDAWKPSTRVQHPKSPLGSSIQNTSTVNGPQGLSNPSPPKSEINVRLQNGFLTYPYPIRPGIQASIILPEDLTPEEAKRLSAFIAALAINYTPDESVSSAQ